ncbi:hypothetical protein RchiOBHm_Chr5g0016201 [Rosa chinensis]|uniref:Uncharacterized protein n=1 Tax=Rosa chinensis TaxID=74649 RepID=A0A2P6Q664_ROSCH|nr:hypothetical protein RchiOBHm_Chr5g0016201 [Rosa chinensis]
MSDFVPRDITCIYFIDVGFALGSLKSDTLFSIRCRGQLLEIQLCYGLLHMFQKELDVCTRV